MCIDPGKAESAGIPKAHWASRRKEKAIRAKLKPKLMRETTPYSQVAGRFGILPSDLAVIIPITSRSYAELILMSTLEVRMARKELTNSRQTQVVQRTKSEALSQRQVV